MPVCTERPRCWYNDEAGLGWKLSYRFITCRPFFRSEKQQLKLRKSREMQPTDRYIRKS